MAITTADSVVFSAKHIPRKAVAISAVGDDYVQINAWGAARVAANDTVGTLSAWVMVPDVTGTYTIIAAGDTNAAQYLHLSIEAGTIFAALKVAAVSWDINSTAIQITPHKWHHVALVQNGTRPIMYVDGTAVAMSDTTATALTDWFDELPNVDNGTIGILSQSTSTTQDLIGAIGAVKHWNSALTAAEVKLDMEDIAPATLGTTGGVSNLISWWDWDGDLVDSVAGHDGTIVSAVYLDAEYSEVTSRLRHEWTVVVGDDITQSVDNGIMYVTIVKA